MLAAVGQIIRFTLAGCGNSGDKTPAALGGDVVASYKLEGVDREIDVTNNATFARGILPVTFIYALEDQDGSIGTI